MQEFHRAFTRLSNGADQFTFDFPLTLPNAPVSICLQSSCASQFLSIVVFQFCGCYTRFLPGFSQRVETAIIDHQSFDVY